MVGCVGIQLFVLQTAVISYPQGHVLKEKEQIIIRLQNQIRDLQAQLAGGAGLMREKEALVMRIKELEGALREVENIARETHRLGNIAPALDGLESILEVVGRVLPLSSSPVTQDGIRSKKGEK